MPKKLQKQKKEKSSTKNKLIKEADKNKDLLIKEIFKLLLEEYECNSFAITNSDEKETIKITIPPLLEKDNYSEKEKKQFIDIMNKLMILKLKINYIFI